MKKIILMLAIIALAVTVSASDCVIISCPVGYELDVDECVCVETDYPLVPDPDETPSGGIGEEGLGFGAAGPETVPEGLLNIIYSFLATYFMWILLFIIFLIVLGVIGKFAGMFTR